MRLNRGTLLILVLAISVIAISMVVSTQPAEAPSDGLVLSEGSVSLPLFDALTADSVTRLVVLNNADGAGTVLARDGEAWTIAQATNHTDRAVHVENAAARVQEALALTASDSFEGQNLADFGLTTPQYIITLADAEGNTKTLYIGGQNPGGTRYYVLLNADAPLLPVTDEATHYEPVTLGESGLIYLVPQTMVNGLANLITNPPYEPAPTATPMPSATLNPLSEVEQATATHEAYAVETQIALTLETEEAEATAEAD